MERLIIGEVGVRLDEGVDKNRFLPDVALQTISGDVQELFESYDYNVDTIPGMFVKTFTLNAKELGEVRDVLTEIEKEGLNEIFEANMRLACFKRNFFARLKRCKDAGMPYLNSDNTFISLLFKTDETELDAYLASSPGVANVPDNVIDINTQVNNFDEMSVPSGEQENDSLAIMDEFDRSLYNEISKSLNYMILQDPTNGNLVSIVQNVLSRLADAILRKEYQFLGVSGMISNIMEDSGITPDRREAGLILNAIPEIEVGRSRAA